MTNELPAASGGTATTPEPLSQDDVYRQRAIERLERMLTRADAILARCQAMTKAKQGDSLGPIFAASRLLNANAQMSKVLLQAALVENRRRLIVETIQPPSSKKAELNSGFTTLEQEEDQRAALNAKITAIVERSRRERERLEDEAIGCCI